MTTASPSSSLICAPRFATPRNPYRETIGSGVAKVSTALRRPFMPWQSLVADVAGEIDPETGNLYYREVVITVPRQSGKTTEELAQMVHRAIAWDTPQWITYTAQSRIKAREKWEDEHLPILGKSAFRGHYRVRKTTGNEAILWENGSRHGIESTTDKAGHGPVLDLGVADEAFAHTDARVEQAMKPAMITRPSAQFHILSTAGTEKSVYLAGKVAAGRERCAAGVHGRVAYFEWSLPDDMDPHDPASWRMCMPALGLIRPDGSGIREDTIASELEAMELAEFRRAYLNQWLDAFPEEWLVITQESWSDAYDRNSAVLDPVAFSLDMNPERSACAIALAGRRTDGLLHGEVVEYRPGTDWAVPRLVELDLKWNPCAIVIDPNSAPAASLITEAEQAGLSILKPSMRQVTQACGQLYDELAENSFRHIGQAPLNVAAAGARQRPLGDAWAWARKDASVDICPLVAVTYAAWGHAETAPLSEPGVWAV